MLRLCVGQLPWGNIIVEGLLYFLEASVRLYRSRSVRYYSMFGDPVICPVSNVILEEYYVSMNSIWYRGFYLLVYRIIKEGVVFCLSTE